MRPASETCPPASASSSTLPHSRIRHLVALACGGLQLALGQPSAGVFGTPAPSLHRQFANFALAGLQPQDTAVPHEQAPVTGVYKAWPTRCTAFQNPPCDHVPGCGAEACCVCSSVAVAIWLQIPGSVCGRSTKVQATGKFDLHRVLLPASSCMRLRALPRAVTRCRGRGRLCTQPCFASAAQCALVSSAPLLSSSPFVGCRALHSCVWRGSLLKSWEPTAA